MGADILHWHYSLRYWECLTTNCKWIKRHPAAVKVCHWVNSFLVAWCVKVAQPCTVMWSQRPYYFVHDSYKIFHTWLKVHPTCVITDGSNLRDHMHTVIVQDGLCRCYDSHIDCLRCIWRTQHYGNWIHLYHHV